MSAVIGSYFWITMVPFGEARLAAVLARLRHGDVEVARDRAPVRSVIVEDQLAAVGAHVLHRRDDQRRPGARLRAADRSGAEMSGGRPETTRRPSSSRSSRSNRAAPRGAAARSTSTTTSMRLATSQGGSFGNMPSMRRSSTTKRPLPRCTPSRPIVILRSSHLPPSTSARALSAGPRSMRQRRHHDDGDDHADRDGKPPAVAIRSADPPHRRRSGGASRGSFPED